MGRSTFDEIVDIINEEYVAATERSRKRIQPILQHEFNRVQSKFPDLERVIFGRKSFEFCFKKGSRFEGARNKSWMPVKLHRLYDLCDAAKSETPEDLLTDKERARRLFDSVNRPKEIAQ